MKRDLLEWAARRLSGLVGRMLITAISNASGVDAQGRQTPIRVDGTTFAGEARHGIAIVQPWGYVCVPMEGSELIYAQVGASESHLVALGSIDPRYLPGDLVPGEPMILTDEGVAIRVRRGRVIEITGAELDVQVTGDATVVVGGSASIEATGDVDVTTALGAVTVTALTADVIATAVTITSTGTFNVAAVGAVVIAGSTLELTGALTINGAPYLAHTHDDVRAGSDTSGPVST